MYYKPLDEAIIRHLKFVDLKFCVCRRNKRLILSFISELTSKIQNKVYH